MNDLKNRIKQLSEKAGIFLEKIGDLTRLQRLLICIVTFALIGGAWYYFVFMPKNEELKKVTAQYQAKVKTLTTYKQRAAEIEKYEKLMAQTQEKFNIAMKALPDKRELPALLTSVSNAGSRAGLEFYLFKPENEMARTFFKEIPVSIQVEGNYHQLTDFFFQVANLSRIVNVNNVEIKNKKGAEKLEMSCKAVTYMFVEQKEEQPKNKRQQRKK